MENNKWEFKDHKWINRDTGTKYDNDGYNYWGYDEDGYNKDGYNHWGYAKDGYNKDGFNIKRIHKNGKRYDDDGYNYFGRDKWGYDKRGFRKARYSTTIFEHINGTEYDNDGFDYYGYDKDGYDRDGYNKFGFNANGIHINGTEQDDDGFDFYGYNQEGYNRDGYNRDGYNKDGYDKKGYNKEGYNKEGLDRAGKNEKERKEIQQSQRKNWLGLKSKAEKLAKGEMTLEEYIKCSKMSIDELIDFAKKEHMDSNVIRGLYKYKKPYSIYKKPFSKKDYLNSTILMIEGKEVRPTEEDVDKCVAYLNAMGTWICDKTVRDTVRSYKKGELDIEETLRNAILDEQIQIKSQETEIANLKSQNKGEI